MMESTGSSRSRDALLEKLRERIKDRDRALEVKQKNINAFIYTVGKEINGSLVELVSRPQTALDTEEYPFQPLLMWMLYHVLCDEETFHQKTAEYASCSSRKRQ